MLNSYFFTIKDIPNEIEANYFRILYESNKNENENIIVYSMAINIK